MAWISGILNPGFLRRYTMLSKYFIPLSFCMMLANTDTIAQKNDVSSVEWKKLATLSNADGSPSLGFAGAINGVNNNALMVAGGANFPDKMPWEGGKKYYSDEIHILQKTDGNCSWNKNVTAKLPEPIAYPAVTSTGMGLVYAGGENEKGLSDKVYLIKWNSSKNKVEIKPLPDLPMAVTNAGLTHIGPVVYLAGGDELKNSSSRFLSLDLSSQDPEWRILPDLPVALANATVLAQKGADGTNIYVIGGRAKGSSGISDLHNTVFIYNPRTQSWKSGASIADGGKPMNFSAGTGVAISDRFLLITGGDNGEVFHQIETYLAKIANAATAEEKANLTAKKNELVIKHQGFYRGILLYNTLTSSWSKLGDLPFPAQVTTTAVKWDENIILSNGEVKPGIRTPDIMIGTVK